ncbi:BZ3500_MvSof-1268-A1-R1_Chr2-1g04486 [Microbotryum saponariae]|uniref:BZ3500_MvSof-1268-A1-R1_Chr2-1g04486 protein n=1 Tax=Microbotryum saponariae TaxID=289078 RepID=A0A2X0KZA5_9BASI|nr:BZ3500_MvSof-1268-A1-R1_Chr2-1g04486 [Microbotryum saponariae]SCZ91818.1 BZ3501_MvSof-1269-A2-R1_Chr2-1g04142 [Microbotryum saponariae]
MTKAPRSQFIERLWDLLDNPHDADSLRWISNSAFEITCDEERARVALSPKWEFRSRSVLPPYLALQPPTRRSDLRADLLSSFIRQLSYYNFTRSGERKGSNAGFVVFSHPSGYFTRQDKSRLHLITRKARNRPESRNSTSAQGQGSSSHSPPSSGKATGSADRMPSFEGFVPPSFEPQYGEERRALLPSLLTSSITSPTNLNRPLRLPSYPTAQPAEPAQYLFAKSYTPTIDGGQNLSLPTQGSSSQGRRDACSVSTPTLRSHSVSDQRFGASSLPSPTEGDEYEDCLTSPQQRYNLSISLPRTSTSSTSSTAEYQSPSASAYPTPATTYPPYHSGSSSISGSFSHASGSSNQDPSLLYNDLHTTRTLPSGLVAPFEHAQPPNGLAWSSPIASPVYTSYMPQGPEQDPLQHQQQQQQRRQSQPTEYVAYSQLVPPKSGSFLYSLPDAHHANMPSASASHQHYYAQPVPEPPENTQRTSHTYSAENRRGGEILHDTIGPVPSAMGRTATVDSAGPFLPRECAMAPSRESAAYGNWPVNAQFVGSSYHYPTQ